MNSTVTNAQAVIRLLAVKFIEAYTLLSAQVHTHDL